MNWIGKQFGAWLGGWIGRLYAPPSSKHVRQQVREAFVARITGLHTTGMRVLESRIHNLAATDLPCLRIYTEQEDIKDDSILDDPYLQHRTITLRCEAVAKAGSGLADLLNTICEEVENAILSEPTLGGLSPLHASHRHADTQADGLTDQPAGMAAMDWQFVVLTMSDAPNAAL